MSFTLNVGTFHQATERTLSTQVARRFVELFFGRLDARTTINAVTKDLVGSYFGGGLGVMMLAILGIFVHDALQNLNALKTFLMLTVTTAAIVVSYYWHFVDVVWILIFTIVYLIQ